MTSKSKQDQCSSFPSDQLGQPIMERRIGEMEASQHHSLHRMPSQAASSTTRYNPGSVTVFARHQIRRGKEHLFEAWIQEISNLQFAKYPGFGGVEVVRPTSQAESNEHVSIFRYDSYEQLQIFMNSQDRQQLLKKTCVFEEAPIELSYHSLEYWFVPGSDGTTLGGSSELPVKPPSKPKMVLVTFLLIWLQVHYIGPAIGKISNIPFLAAEALTVFIVVLGTTYLWMPITTQYILNWWLFPKTTSSPSQNSTTMTKSTPESSPSKVGRDESVLEATMGTDQSRSSTTTSEPTNLPTKDEELGDALDV